MKMLTLELSGQKYNKSEHRRGLVARLDGRTEGAVEKKNQNISAILEEHNCFWIPGYKPQHNAQGLLRTEVTAWLELHPEFETIATEAAEGSVVSSDLPSFDGFQVPKPDRNFGNKYELNEERARYGTAGVRVPFKRDYAALEAKNRSLGMAGEETVVRFEQFRLSQANADRWAGKVEHVAKTKGDGLGFDILSFETDGRERFIEVKTTAFAKETSFFASANEVRFSETNSQQFHLYRVFDFKKSPRCFVVPGSISDQCHLDPVNYRCSI